MVKKKKKSPANAGDTRDVGSIPGLGISPGVGNGHRPHNSCLEKMSTHTHIMKVHPLKGICYIKSVCMCMHVCFCVGALMTDQVFKTFCNFYILSRQSRH